MFVCDLPKPACGQPPRLLGAMAIQKINNNQETWRQSCKHIKIAKKSSKQLQMPWCSCFIQMQQEVFTWRCYRAVFSADYGCTSIIANY